MHLSFRGKLATIVGTATLAFAVLIGVQTVLAERAASGVSRIREHFIPLLELGPRLEADFDRLRRGFQDSVASQDREGLGETAALRDTLLRHLDAGAAQLEAGQVASLKAAVAGYYDTAFDVSGRLLKGEGGPKLVGAMTLMQDKQRTVETIIQQSMSLDRDKLLEAFAAISRAQKENWRALLAVSALCLGCMVLLSWTVGRSVIRSLSFLNEGLARFGKGDFSRPIQVVSSDELGTVAREANQMAGRIQGLLKDLESFSYSVAHDLRAPVRGMLGFSNILLDEHGAALPGEAKDLIARITRAADRMGRLIDSLLDLSRVSRKELRKTSVDLSRMAEEIVAELRGAHPDREVEVRIEPGAVFEGDSSLLHVVMTNLLANAWKFSSKKPGARIEVGTERKDGRRVCVVRDNGAGFDMDHASKLFGTFQRLHTESEFAGTGIGLAMVQRIVKRHGGEIWAEGKPGEGAAFRFTL